MRATRRARTVPAPIYAMAFVNACIGLGYGVVAPVIPVFARNFGVSDFAASSVVSIYALTRVLASFGAARILLRLNERSVLQIGLLIAATSSLAAAYAPTFWILLLMRALGGIGTAMFTVAGQQLLFRYSTPQTGGRVASVFQSGFLIGGVLGPVVGGAVAVLSMKGPFLAHAAALLVGVVVVIVALRRRGGEDGTTDAQNHIATRNREQMTLRQAWSHRGFRAAVFNNFSNGWLGNGMRFTLIPLFVVAVIGASPFVSGLLLFVGAAVQFAAVAPSGMLVDRWGRRPMLAAGSVLVLVGIVLLTAVPTIEALFAVMVLWGIGGTFAMVASAATVGDVLEGRGGTPIATYQVSFDTGTMLGPLVAGAIASGISYPAAFATGIPIAVIAALLCVPRWQVMHPQNTVPPQSSKAAAEDAVASNATTLRKEERCLAHLHSDGSPTTLSPTGTGRGPELPEATGVTEPLQSMSSSSSKGRGSTL